MSGLLTCESALQFSDSVLRLSNLGVEVSDVFLKSDEVLLILKVEGALGGEEVSCFSHEVHVHDRVDLLVFVIVEFIDSSYLCLKNLDAILVLVDLILQHFISRLRLWILRTVY